MAWKQIKQFEVCDTHGGYLPNGDETWNAEVPHGTKVRVTYEVQEPRFVVKPCDGEGCCYLYDADKAGYVNHFPASYFGGPQAAAEAEAARLNALEDAS